jgi:hypothetical protein
MRRIYLVLAAAGLAIGPRAGGIAAENAPLSADLLARYYFAGTVRLGADTNAAQLKMIWNLPASSQFREQVLQKLARTPRQLFQRGSKTPLEERSALFRPLLDDWLRVESFGEIRGQTNQPLEWALALRLEEDRALSWQRSIREVLVAWGVGQATDYAANGAQGWEIKPTESGARYRFVRSGEWCVLGSGQDRWLAFNETLKQTRTKGAHRAQAGADWLTLQVNWPQLAHWRRPWPLACCGPESLPSLELAAASKDDMVRTKAELNFAIAPVWRLEPWQVPTNWIRDPLISFTAVQGIGSWLARQPFIKQWEIIPAPNQFFLWAQSEVPFQSFVAAPIKQVTNVLQGLAARLPAWIRTNSPYQNVGEFLWITNQTRLVWRGLPIIVPYLHPAQEPAGEFLLGGLFPAPLSPNPSPAELYAQFIGRTNLLYYDWEITAERLPQIRLLMQLNELIATTPDDIINAETNRATSYAQPWLTAIGPHLGNTITEIAIASPRHLSLARKSHLGLTGLELAYLARWLDDPRFPLLSRNRVGRK